MLLIVSRAEVMTSLIDGNLAGITSGVSFLFNSRLTTSSLGEVSLAGAAESLVDTAPVGVSEACSGLLVLAANADAAVKRNSRTTQIEVIQGLVLRKGYLPSLCLFLPTTPMSSIRVVPGVVCALAPHHDPLPEGAAEVGHRVRRCFRTGEFLLPCGRQAFLPLFSCQGLCTNMHSCA